MALEIVKLFDLAKRIINLVQRMVTSGRGVEKKARSFKAKTLVIINRRNRWGYISPFVGN